MESLFTANWIRPFQWLPVEDRGPRFLEWLEEVEAKFELIDWPEKSGDAKKRKAFLAVAGPEVRNKVGTLKGDTGNDYETLIQGLKEDLLRDEPLMFPNRNFKTKVPTLKPTTPYHHDKEVREHDRLKKEAMKRYADSKRYVKEHKVKTGDAVLVPQKKKNKFTTPYRNMKYVVIKVKGSMITARNELGHIITRDASKMKKVQERELDTDDEEPPRPNDLLREPENEVKKDVIGALGIWHSNNEAVLNQLLM
jgi:hypothetical protein